MLWRLFTAGVVVLILVTAVRLTSEGESRRELLNITPVGSTFETVLAVCGKRHWRCSQSTTVGYLNQDNGVVVGSRSIWTAIRDANVLFVLSSDTEINWGFDSNGKLLDIWTRHSIDGP